MSPEDEDLSLAKMLQRLQRKRLQHSALKDLVDSRGDGNDVCGNDGK